MKDLGLSQGLINAVGDVLKTSQHKRAENMTEHSSKISAQYEKTIARPRSVEESKAAADVARAPQIRVYDTIASVIIPKNK